MSSLTDLPHDLPVPTDDGACDHLPGMRLPDLALPTTQGNRVNFSSLPGAVVIYAYPMTGRPGIDLPAGWNQIPGARGCTPQSCSFRDHFGDLQKLHASVYGLSTQASDYQAEAASRLHLPFPLVSDAKLQFINALSLPTLRVDDRVLSKRITIIANAGIIEKVFYPVFPADKNANEVIAYLSGQSN